MRSLLRLLLLVVVAIIVYNYFFGTAEEKQQSEKIINEVRDLGRSAWNLLKTEKEKFDEGKYDEALNKIGGLIDNLKDKAETLKDSSLMDDIANLERKRDELQRRVDMNRVEEYDTGGDGLRDEEADQIKKDWKDLMNDMENVMNKLEKN